MNIACDSCKQVGTSTKLRSYSYLPTVYLPVSLENSFKYDTVPGRQLGLNLIRVGTYTYRTLLPKSKLLQETLSQGCGSGSSRIRTFLQDPYPKVFHWIRIRIPDPDPSYIKLFSTIICKLSYFNFFIFFLGKILKVS